MSGALADLGIHLPSVGTGTWLDNYRPASFRGVPFYVDAHQLAGGRRLAAHEFPQRDTPDVEDLGARHQKFRVRAYILQDSTGNYFSARNALYAACHTTAGSGTLLHPYLGRVTVFCETVTVSEQTGQGGMAAFDLMFWDAGTVGSPNFTPDTASNALSALNRVLRAAVQVYTLGSLIASRPSILLGVAEGLAGQYVAGVLGIAPGVALQVASIGGSLLSSLGSGGAPVISRVTGATGDPVAVATTDLATAAATAILNPAQPTTTSSGDLVTARLMPADPSGGMAAIATFGVNLPRPVGLGATQALGLQTMLVDAMRTAAVLATAQIYANTDFTASDAAAAARAQLLGFLDERIAAAAAAGQDDLYQAWLSMAGVAAADLTQRAQNLPRLSTYISPATQPACVVAQRLYQDGARAIELAALNHAPHPGFMPQTGLALAS